MIKSVEKITWKIGGAAGFGIMSTGEMFARACMRAGLHVFTYPEYPSLVRGGHNTVQVTVAAAPVTAHENSVNILVALNKETVDLHLDELKPRGVIIYDTTDRTFANFDPATVKRRQVQWLGLPLEKLARDNGGQILMRNSVALGASCAFLDIPTTHLDEILADTFKDKGPEVVALNARVLMAGYQAVDQTKRRACPWSIVPTKHRTPQVLLTGNEALALGAIQAGCQLYSAYPMTPASSILHYLAAHGAAHGMVVRHAEDEIAAVHHAIGAAYTGVRAMTGTSGGGFALMTEAVGLAAMAEVGIVIVNAQRGGPSTGLPTWTEQGDLRQVLHASQGDFPRIVLAPSNHQECFEMVQDAFNLADQYQTPVIVLTDKYLAEGQANVPVSAFRAKPIKRGKIWTTGKDFLRYQTKVTDGVAPRSLPGTPHGLFLANSDEHNEYGYTTEDIDMRLAQMNRRARKEQAVSKNALPPRLIGPKTAALTVITWGSSAGSVAAALDILHDEHGVAANAAVITSIAPLPVAALTKIMKSTKKTVIVEANQSGQLAGWIRQQTRIKFDQALNRYDGRPFDPAELASQFKKLTKSR